MGSPGVLGVGPPFGIKSFSVGVGGLYPDINTAINSLGSRFVVRRSLTDTLTVTNGSATMSGFTANTTRAANNLGVGDLIKIGSDTRYYKIKAVNGGSPFTITLWEPYQGTSLSGVSTPYTTSYLSRIALLVLPGELNYTNAILQPGFDLYGIAPYTSFLDETSGTNPWPLANFGENNITGLCFQPGSVWGDLDHMMGSVNPNIWGGADNRITNCLVVNGDLRDFHAGGELSYPVQNGGRTTYMGCVFRSARTPIANPGGAVTPTTANTECNFDFCRFEGIWDTESETGEIFPCGIVTDVPATFNFNHPIIEIPDRALPSFAGDVTGFLVGEPTGASTEGPCVVNIYDPQIVVANSGTRNVEGIAVTSASTVNIFGGSVNASGTSAIGLQVNNASAVVNVLKPASISGSSSNITKTAGTLNYKDNPLVQSLPYAATITIDPNEGDRVIIGSITGALALANPTNPQIGQRLSITLSMGATVYGVTLGSAFEGTVPAATASTKIVLNYQYDGTRWNTVGGTPTWG